MTNIEDMSREQIESHLSELQDNENKIKQGEYKNCNIDFTIEEYDGSKNYDFYIKVKIMRDNPDDLIIRIPDGVNNSDVKDFFSDLTTLHL